MKDGGASFAVSPSSHGKKYSGGMSSQVEARRNGVETTKKRRMSPAKQAAENSSQSDNNDHSALPCLVSLAPGVRIVSVAAGGRHTLALSGEIFSFSHNSPSPEWGNFVLKKLVMVSPLSSRASGVL